MKWHPNRHQTLPAIEASGDIKRPFRDHGRHKSMINEDLK